MARRADLLVHGDGRVYLLRPVSRCGSAWMEQHIASDATWFGGAVVVEHRYIRDIVAGATRDGLEVQ